MNNGIISFRWGCRRSCCCRRLRRRRRCKQFVQNDGGIVIEFCKVAAIVVSRNLDIMTSQSVVHVVRSERCEK